MAYHREDDQPPCPTCAQKLRSDFGSGYSTCDACGGYIERDPPYSLNVHGYEDHYDACSLRCYKVLIDKFVAETDFEDEEEVERLEPPPAANRPVVVLTTGERLVPGQPLQEQ